MILKKIKKRVSDNDITGYFILEGNYWCSAEVHFKDNITLLEAFELYPRTMEMNKIIGGEVVSVTKQRGHCTSLRVILFRDFIEKIDEKLIEIVKQSDKKRG